jgi:hypothetical protein
MRIASSCWPYAFCALAFIACAQGTVRIPEVDGTPPSAALEVAGGPEPMRLAVGDEPRAVDLSGGDSLVLTAVAEDGDGGVRELSLQGNALVTCRDPATGRTAVRSTGFLRRTVPGSFPRTRAPARKDSRFVLRGGDIAKLCPGGILEAAVGQATVRAANFHGGNSASPRLEFRLAATPVSATAIPMPAANGTGLGAVRGTGFGSEPGVGGSGSPAAAPAPLCCPRSAAPARDPSGASAPKPGCLDPPVPFVSPPGASGSKGAAAPRFGAFFGGKTAQRTQIRSPLP